LPWFYSVFRGGCLIIVTPVNTNPFFPSSGLMITPFRASSHERLNIQTTSLSLAILLTTLR
jgi:hypothetical protein